MKNYKDLKKKLLKTPIVKREYDLLSGEYDLIQQLITKRLEAGLTQTELAREIGTRQSAIARLESGNYNPTIGMLRKVSKALKADLRISIE